MDKIGKYNLTVFDFDVPGIRKAHMLNKKRMWNCHIGQPHLQQTAKCRQPKWESLPFRMCFCHKVFCRLIKMSAILNGRHNLKWCERQKSARAILYRIYITIQKMLYGASNYQLMSNSSTIHNQLCSLSVCKPFNFCNCLASRVYALVG